MKFNLITAFLTSASLFAAGNAFAQNLSVYSATGAPGSTVNISITTDASVANLAGVQFTLNFGDSSPSSAPKLTIDTSKVIAGPLFSNALVTANLADSSDVNIALVSTSPANGAGIAAVVAVKIPASAPNGAVYSLKIKNVQGSDLNGDAISVNGQGGTLTAVSQTTTPTGGVGFTLTTGAGTAGGVAEVDLSSTDQISDLTSFTIQLQFDKILTIQSSDVVFSSLVKGLTLVNDKTAGALTIGVVGTAPIAQSGVLARMNFHISSSASAGASYALKVTSLDASNSKAVAISTTASNGQVVISSSTATTPTISGGLISVSSVKVGKSGTATVEISANDKIKNLTGAIFQLSYGAKTPSSAPDLTYVANSATAGSFLKSALVNVNASAANALTVGVVSGTAANGPGTLAKFSFKVGASAANNTVYSLTLSGITLSVNGSDATSASNGGTITVQSAKKGDLNGDDKVSIADATMALQAALGEITLTSDQLAVSDFNGDGKISISEVTMILQAALGLKSLGD